MPAWVAVKELHLSYYIGETILGGHGDLVSRSIIGILWVTIWVIAVIILLTKSP